MAVSVATNRKDYVGDAVITVFAYDFLIFTASEMTVFLDGVLQSDYVVSNVGNESGGNVTFTTAPPLAANVLLLRNVIETQTTDFPPNTAFPETSIENALDKLTMLIQQVSEKQGRSPTLASETLLSDVAFPEGSTPALKFIRWNAAGTALELVSAANSDLTVVTSTGKISGTGGGTANVQTFTSDPVLSSLVNEVELTYKPTISNTASMTLNPDGLGATAVKKRHGATLVNLAAGDITIDVQATLLFLTQDNAFVLLNPSTEMHTDRVQTISAIQTHTAIQKLGKGADIASAGALVLGTDGNYFDVTGAVTINTIGTVGVGTVVTLHFDGALTLTHQASDLVLPNSTNITTVAGDEAIFREYATGDWRLISYSPVRALHLLNNAASGSIFNSSDIQIRGSVPMAKVTDAGLQSLTNNVVTDIEFDTESFDNDAIHDISSNNQRLTAKTAGKYLIVAQIEFAFHASGQRQVTIRKNDINTAGDPRVIMDATAANDQVISLTGVFDLSVNDWVSARGFQNSGGALSTGNDTYFSMHWIGV